MIYPDIKSYRKNFRTRMFEPTSEQQHFMGRKIHDLFWDEKKPAANIKKNGNLFELELAMPGFSKEEVNVSIKGDVLIVRGEKKRLEKPSSVFVLKEFDHDLIERQFKLDRPVEKESIKAAFKHGLLKLTFFDVPVTVNEDKIEHVEIM